MLTRVEQWEEWVDRCAADRCAPGTAAALRRFGAFRFGRYLGICLGQDAAAGVRPDDRDCFHLFETHCCVARGRAGKRYKEWLAARGGGASGAAAFESGASLLMRDVVRSFVRRECPSPRQVPADAVIDGTDGLTLADLLPADADGASAPPDAARADAIARAVLSGLADAHRAVVLARGCGVPLSDPGLLALLGVGKSRTAALWAEVYRRVAAETRRQVPEGDSRCWLPLALQAAERLGTLVFSRERVENRWRGYFKGVEGGADE